MSIDFGSGRDFCAVLTKDDVGDPTALPGLLDQDDGPVDLFLAAGAYDGNSSRSLLVERFGTEVEVIISPPKTQSSARTQRCIRRSAIAILPKYRHTDDWLGREPQPTISVAGGKLSWAAGKPLSGPS